MLDLRLVRIFVTYATFIALNSCGKTNPTGSNPNNSSTISSFKPYSSVKNALFSDLPNGFRTATPANTLQKRAAKSREACEVKKQFEVALENRRPVENILCAIENSNIGSNGPGKYKINIKKNGQKVDEVKLYIDGTSTQFQVNLCDASGHYFSLSVADRNDNGIKGSVKQKFQHSIIIDQLTSKGFINFDASFDTTIKGRVLMDAKHAGTVPGNATRGEHKWLYSSKTDFNEGGISSAIYSEKETQAAPAAYSEVSRGAGKSNSSFGQAIVNFTSSRNGSESWTRRGSVNQAGDKIANNTVSNDVQVNLSEVPTELSDSFSVDGPSGWDCQTTSEIDVDFNDDLARTCNIASDEWIVPVCSGTEAGEDISSVSP